jgi:hypothetical protein
MEGDMELLYIKLDATEVFLNVDHIVHVKKFDNGEVSIATLLSQTTVRDKEGERIWGIFKRLQEHGKLPNK